MISYEVLVSSHSSRGDFSHALRDDFSSRFWRSGLPTAAAESSHSDRKKVPRAARGRHRGVSLLNRLHKSPLTLTHESRGPVYGNAAENKIPHGGIGYYLGYMIIVLFVRRDQVEGPVARFQPVNSARLSRSEVFDEQRMKL